ncbi:MAG: outer membrane beta-barrel protein [Pseudomonadota bacterium]
MLKKIITTGLLSVSALAIITANAATPADASHDAKNNKKHTHHTSVTRKSKPAPVAKVNEAKNNDSFMQAISLQRNGGLPAGLYVSGQVGYADTNMKSKLPADVGVGLANDGLASRLAMGYKFNQNFAIEVGYLQLQKETINGGNISTSNQQNAIDIAGKGILPITHNVNIYGKVGAAYLTTQLEEKHNDTVPVTIDLNNQYGIAKHQWAPEVAVGMGYDITPNVSVDTSFTHIHPVASKRAGNINYLAVGVGYTFG